MKQARKNWAQILAFVLAVALIFSMTPIQVFAASGSATVKSDDAGNALISVAYSGSDNTGSWDASTGVYTATVAGKYSSNSNTITIVNEGSSQAKISFTYSASNYSSFSLSDAAGTYTATLDAGGSATITIKNKANWTSVQTATLTLSNFTYEMILNSAQITFAHNSLGTVTIGETVVESGSTVSVDKDSSVVATAGDGSTFLGWINSSTNELLTTDATWTAAFTTETLTVEPVFVNSSSNAYFKIGNYLCDDLGVANEKASSSSTIIAVNDGIVPAGDYTISAGVTLLIPFDAANTLYTTQPGLRTIDTDNAYVKPVHYRTLTLAQGANLTINGAMSLSSKVGSSNGGHRSAGSPIDSTSIVNMNAGSTITVNNGGALYAWGFITGSGSVVAKSGATVYESFQVEDFRGGSETSGMASRTNGVFPLSQYYVQNIEVPLTLEAGATEYGFTSLRMKLLATNDYPTTIKFISSSSAMFSLTSGSLTKRYDGTTDRLIVDINGTVELQNLSLKIATTSIDSKDYDLPINSNITVNVKNGAEVTVKQDLAMLPGSKIIIDDGGALTLSSGYNMYVYDAAEWGTYVGAGKVQFLPTQYAPGRTYNRTTADLVDVVIEVNGTLDASVGYIYTTAGGASICSTGNGVAEITAGTQTATHQHIQGVDGDTAIAITSAKLQNSDGTYVSTNVSGTYTYNGSVWQTSCETNGHSYDTGVVTVPTCTEDGYTTYTCSVCGDSYTDTPVAATGHTVVTDAAVDPTCTETGLTEGSHCSVCNEVIVAQSIVNATGHSYTNYVSNDDAKCETDGTKTATCDNGCGETSTVTDEGTALSHSYNNYVSNNDAKCEIDGTKTATCDNGCGETSTVTDEGTALSHTYTNYTVNTTATCINNRTEIASCDHGCGTTNIVTIENSTVDHSYGEYTSNNNATCTADGTKTASCIYGCSTTDTVADTGSALGHSYTNYVSNGDATCLANGTETATCDNGCGTTDTREDADSALGHSFTNYVPNDDAVCGVDGTKTAKCDRCDETDTVTNTGSALDHSFTTYVSNNDATCLQNCTETASCDYGCGETKTREIADSKLEHVYTNYVSNGDATCLADGSKTAKCDRNCGTDNTITDEGSALGHSFTTYTVQQAATCTVPGSEIAECDRDNCDATDVKEMAVLNHSYGEYVNNNDATCTADGTKTATCTMCQTAKDTVTDVGSMLDHTYGDWEETLTATCTTEGAKRRDCVNCDAYETGVIPVTEHSYGDWVITTDPTCTEAGEQRRDCDDCEAFETEVLAATEHNYVGVVTEPTCTDAGYTTYTCSKCGDTYTDDEVAALSHKYVSVVTEPTCTTGGYTTHTCSACGDTYTDSHVEAVSHNYQAVVTAPTCTAEGYTTYTCSACGDNYTADTVPATGNHADNDSNYKCDVCDTVVGAVAQVGETYYGSLADAIAAGDEVTLLANVTEEVVVTKVVSIVKNGFTANVVAGEGYELAETENAYVVSVKAVMSAALTAKSAALLLEDLVHIKFYYAIESDLTQEYLENNGGIIAWQADQYPGDDAVSIDDETADVYPGLTYTPANGRYGGVTEGIPLKYLNDTLVIVGYVQLEDGTYVYSAGKEYSGRIYAENRINKIDAMTTPGTELEYERDLCIALLNTIAEAQVYFNYCTDDPANASLSDVRKDINWTGELLTPADAVDANKTLERDTAVFTGRSASLNLEGNTELFFYFAIPDATKAAAQDTGVLFWTADAYKNAETLNAATATYDVEMTYNEGKGRWCAVYPEGFATKEYENTVYACAYLIDAEGETQYSGLVSYSVDQYCINQINKSAAEAELCKDLVTYGEMAKVYFEFKNS